MKCLDLIQRPGHAQHARRPGYAGALDGAARLRVQLRLRGSLRVQGLRVRSRLCLSELGLWLEACRVQGVRVPLTGLLASGCSSFQGPGSRVLGRSVPQLWLELALSPCSGCRLSRPHPTGPSKHARAGPSDLRAPRAQGSSEGGAPGA